MNGRRLSQLACIVNLKLLISILLLFISLTTFAQHKKMSHEEYITRYSAIAIREMKEFGIPASITLAQGLLESGSGNSSLAREANNHFGIKCHAGWAGEGFYMDDDEKNECFRVYDNPDESYVDHSSFLTSRGRYSFLFDLDIFDYKGWAHGLKKAGYATNPKYPQLLITLIERHKLYQFDKGVKYTGQVVKPNQQQNPNNLNTSYVPASTSEYLFLETSPRGRKIYMNNGVKFIYAKSDDTFFLIAEEFDIYPHSVRKYNELENDEPFEIGEIVYIEKKKSKGELSSYQCNQGESMRYISQRFGVRLKKLYKYNTMEYGAEPAAGQVIKLRR